MIYVLGTAGGALNFEILGGTTQPSYPEANTIWVNTSEKITGWQFSGATPASTNAGFVWLQTATTGGIALNALKKNVIWLRVIAAKQYVNGAWVKKAVAVYQSGEWVKGWDGELYMNGTDYTNITGGWAVGNVPPPGWDSYKSATLTKNAGNMVFKGRLNTLYSINKIDVTNYKTMVFKGSVNAWSTIRVKPTKDSQENGAYIDWSTGQTERRVDISGLTGSHYICLSIYDADNSTITLTEVYME